MEKWKRSKSCTLDYIGACFSVILARQFRYKNMSAASKISEISLSTGDEESDPFRMFITVSTSADLKELRDIFNKNLLSGRFTTFEKTGLCFDAKDLESFMPFFNVIKVFEPSVAELTTELTSKYNRDYTDYYLDNVPEALVEAKSSVKHPSDNAIDSNIFKPNKCIRYTQKGTKRAPEAFAEVKPSVKRPCDDAVDSDIFESKKCIRYTQKGIKRAPEALRSSQRIRKIKGG